MNHGRIIVQGDLAELSGEEVLIIETSSPVDPLELGRRLGCAVSAIEPTRLHCAIASSPERVALVSEYLQEQSVALTSLRTRASLEERYLDLIAGTPEVTP
jgi:hypothetical protein